MNVRGAEWQAPAAPKASDDDRMPSFRAGDVEIDLERVIYDPAYRAWARDQLNGRPHPARTMLRAVR
ncbi:MAG: hypothetical protein WCF16_07930 [Alphaproteobacteria bacterium]